MKTILHPIFALLASVTRQELARQVAYLKEENRILRARLPERLVATVQEKRRLLKFGRRLGVQLRNLISIVTYQTFVRWIREKEAAHTEKKTASDRKPRRLETAHSLLPISAARRPPAVEACFLPCSSCDSLFPSKSFHPLNFLLRFLPRSLLQGGGPPDSV